MAIAHAIEHAPLASACRDSAALFLQLLQQAKLGLAVQLLVPTRACVRICAHTHAHVLLAGVGVRAHKEVLTLRLR